MRLTVILLFCLGLFCAPLMAQPDIQVGKIDPIKVIWGPQTIYAQVTNTLDYPKLISACVRINFNGRYLHPKRAYRTNFFIEPQVTVSMPIKLEIPPNFGEANISLELYDVIDTLDPFFPEQKLTEERSRLLFAVPDPLFNYMQERITMPPMTDNSPLFDSEVARLAFMLFREGKDDREIARLTKIDTIYLRQIIWKWKYYEFLAVAKQDSSLRPSFPIITIAEAEELKPLADKVTTQLTALIQKNLKAYDKVRDSLVASGSLTKDSNNVLHGGTILYHPYPVVTALLLWYSLGRGFISGTGTLDFYRETDPCNAHVLPFMYAVQGGNHFNGHQYASFSINQGLPLVLFADTLPEIRCPEFSPFVDRLQPGDWSYGEHSGPEFFVLDTGLVHPALRALSKGSDKIVQMAFDSLRTTVEKYETGSFVPGVCWWFWNLISTQTTEQLIEKGTLKRYGNGHYRLEVVKI